MSLWHQNRDRGRRQFKVWAHHGQQCSGATLRVVLESDQQLAEEEFEDDARRIWEFLQRALPVRTVEALKELAR